MRCAKIKWQRVRRSATTAAAGIVAMSREGVDPVVRFKNPLNGEVVVNDLVRGRVVFDNAQLDDLIIGAF